MDGFLEALHFSSATAPTKYKPAIISHLLLSALHYWGQASL
jgi:hypothetical protein